MDENEQFSLRWKNFHSNLQAGFEELLAADELTDVTLACEGRTLRAHKNVLAVCSPYFRSLFKMSPCKHPIIFMQEVKLQDLQAILQFMYRGQTALREQDLPMFLKTADALQVRGLAQSNMSSYREVNIGDEQSSDLTPSPSKRKCLSSVEEMVNKDEVKIKPESEDDFESQENGDTEASLSNSAGPSTTNEYNTPEKRNEGFLCSICNKIYTSRYNLKAHERNLHGSSARPAKCDICHKIFKNDDALRTHTYYKHTGPDAVSGQTHKCKICNKTYKLRHDLVSHEKNVHGELAKPYKCELCLKFCKNWHALQTHKSRNHKQDAHKNEPQ